MDVNNKQKLQDELDAVQLRIDCLLRYSRTLQDLMRDIDLQLSDLRDEQQLLAAAIIDEYSHRGQI